MKKLQLINRIDHDGEWWILRHIDGDEVRDKHFSNKETAESAYSEAVKNAEMLRKETIVKEYEIPV